jgi:hypothetical protein
MADIRQTVPTDILGTLEIYKLLFGDHMWPRAAGRKRMTCGGALSHEKKFEANCSREGAKRSSRTRIRSSKPVLSFVEGSEIRNNI